MAKLSESAKQKARERFAELLKAVEEAEACKCPCHSASEPSAGICDACGLPGFVFHPELSPCFDDEERRFSVDMFLPPDTDTGTLPRVLALTACNLVALLFQNIGPVAVIWEETFGMPMPVAFEEPILEVAVELLKCPATRDPFLALLVSCNANPHTKALRMAAEAIRRLSEHSDKDNAPALPILPVGGPLTTN